MPVLRTPQAREGLREPCLPSGGTTNSSSVDICEVLLLYGFPVVSFLNVLFDDASLPCRSSHLSIDILSLLTKNKIMIIQLLWFSEFLSSYL